MSAGSTGDRAIDEPRVRVRGLSYAYRPDRRVLDSIDFEVRAGEVVAMLGRNGSGKTTLLRLLAGLLRPSAGGVDLASGPAVVTDRTPFLESLTARENLHATLALCGHDASEIAPRAECWLGRFALLGAADRPVDEFSLGMRRRLALAEGFAGGRGIVLLDEPTTGLDPDGRVRLATILAEVSSDGVVVVFATNDAEFAGRACDSVLLLHRGIVAVRGAPSKLIAELEAPTVLEIETVGSPPTSAPPAGVELVARSVSGLTLSGPNASTRLLDVWAWLESENCSLREVRIREPGLADVFRAHTGEELPAPHDRR